MKKVFILILLIFANIYLFSQYNCNNIPSSIIAQGSIPSFPSFPRSIKHVKIKFHYVVKDDGTSDLKPDIGLFMNTLINELNIRYTITNETDLDFYYNPCEIEIIKNNSTYYGSKEQLFSLPHDPNALNVYINKNADAYAENIPGIKCCIPENTDFAYMLLAHEVGHCFGLYHTHHGTCDEGNSDPNEAPEIPITGDENTGDYCKKTPADPGLNKGFGSGGDGFQWHVTDECVYAPELSNFCADPTKNYTPLTDNLMSYSKLQCRSKFTDDQIDRMHFYIDTDIYGSSGSRVDHFITNSNYINSTSLTGNIFFLNDVIVNAGVTLHLNTSDIKFLQKKSIIVKNGGILILQGSTINVCDLIHLWSGIKIETGGQVVASNSTIKNAENAFEGIGSKLDLSNNTKIIDCKNGINTKGGGNLMVNDCRFENCDIAILKTEANANLNFVQISESDFINNDIDIMTQGGSIDGYNIFQNNFSGKDYGVLIDGDNKVFLANNTFVNSYGGTIMNSTGDNTNMSVDNDFNSLLVGVQTQGSNNLYMAIENCFNTGAGDMYLDGSVNGFMGNTDLGAGNCFTKNTIPDISAVTNVFEYYVANQSNSSCFNPFTQSSYTKPQAISDPTTNCGSTNPVFPTVKWNYCYPRKKLTCAEIELYLTQVQNEINYTTSSTAFTANNKANILKYLKACKFRLIKLKLFNCIPHVPAPQDPELDMSQRLKDKADKVALAIESSNYSLATTLLNSFSDNSEEGLDFKFVQILNVQRLIQGSSFVLSNADRNALLTIANKSQPLTGYARGLYYLLTGEFIMPNITRYAGGPRSSKDNNEDVQTIYPNPFTNYLDLSSLSKEAVIRIVITDSYGRIKFNSDLIPETINTIDWYNGLYLVKVIFKDETYKTIKLIK